MIKKIFTIARSDKKTQKKALQQLDEHEGRIDASEILGGKIDNNDKGGFFIRQEVSSQINSSYQNPDEII
ncbi:MAG: hypothetical protein V4585_12085 [Bacteroidota bacterium]|jgi:hypothetical protein